MGIKNKNVVYCIHDKNGNRITLNGDKAAFSNVGKLRKRYSTATIVPYVGVDELMKTREGVIALKEYCRVKGISIDKLETK